MQNKTMRLSPIAIQLSDKNTNPPEKIQVIRTGTFHAPAYGKFEVTKAHLLSFKKNFEKKVRGVDIALDYAHDSGREAAAWFTGLELSDDGTELWATTSWTPQGGEKVTSKEYRYVSADFNFDYEDNETLEKHGPTLLGAGLTNRPVVKGQAPVIELTEGKGSEMTPEEKAKLEALDKSVQDIKSAIEEIKSLLKEDVEAGEKDDDKEKPEALKETEKKLSEATSKIAEMEKSQKEATKKTEFDKMLSEGRVVEAQRVPFMADDMAKFISLQKSVKLSEQGSEAGGNSDKKTPAEEVKLLAEKMVADKKASTMSAAFSMVLSENAELAKRFHEAR